MCFCFSEAQQVRKCWPMDEPDTKYAVKAIDTKSEAMGHGMDSSVQLSDSERTWVISNPSQERWSNMEIWWNMCYTPSAVGLLFHTQKRLTPGPFLDAKTKTGRSSRWPELGFRRGKKWGAELSSAAEGMLWRSGWGWPKRHLFGDEKNGHLMVFVVSFVV